MPAREALQHSVTRADFWRLHHGLARTGSEEYSADNAQRSSAMFCLPQAFEACIHTSCPASGLKHFPVGAESTAGHTHLH